MIALKEDPAALDLYLLQARKSYLLLKQGKAECRIPLLPPRTEGEKGSAASRAPVATGRAGEEKRYVPGTPSCLKEQLGTATEDEWKFKQQLRGWQELVSEKWVGCPNELSEDGRYLILRPARALEPNAKMALRAIVRSTDRLPIPVPELSWDRPVSPHESPEAPREREAFTS